MLRAPIDLRPPDSYPGAGVNPDTHNGVDARSAADAQQLADMALVTYVRIDDVAGGNATEVKATDEPRPEAPGTPDSAHASVDQEQEPTDNPSADDDGAHRPPTPPAPPSAPGDGPRAGDEEPDDEGAKRDTAGQREKRGGSLRSYRNAPRPIPDALHYPPDEPSDSLYRALGIAAALPRNLKSNEVANVIAEREHRINMPPLTVVPYRGKHVEQPLSPDQQERIIARAKTVTAAPYRPGKRFQESDIPGIQTWFDGMTLGAHTDTIAYVMGVSPRTVTSMTRRLCDYLEVDTVPGAVYSLLFHQYEPEIHTSGGADELPQLKSGEGLHTYLAAIGTPRRTAASLAGAASVSTVESALWRAQVAFGADSIPQAIIRAFELGHFNRSQVRLS